MHDIDYVRDFNERSAQAFESVLSKKNKKKKNNWYLDRCYIIKTDVSCNDVILPQLWIDTCICPMIM